MTTERPFEDHYQALELQPGASLDDIEAAYKRLIRKWHPDRNRGNPEAFERTRRINVARDVLTNRRSRTEYDRDYRSSKTASSRRGRSQDTSRRQGWADPQKIREDEQRRRQAERQRREREWLEQQERVRTEQKEEGSLLGELRGLLTSLVSILITAVVVISWGSVLLSNCNA